MFQGTVIRGDGIGRTIGYPTANLDIPPMKTGLADGVYAARASVFGNTYGAALVIQHEAKKVEVHMVGYAGNDCYGETLYVETVQKISDIEKKDGEELRQKIARDIEAVQR